MRFQTYDLADDTWHVLDEAPFQPREAQAGLLFAVRAERGQRADPDEDEAPAALGREDDDARSVAEFPSIAILPGGEITPFEVVVSSGDLPPWSARSDGIARVLAEPQGAPEARSIARVR